MADQVQAFYDELADDYHLIFADWQASIDRQANILDKIITEGLGAGPHRVLDCACGIGTQSLGLAARGHQIHATDLSPAAVKRLRSEAASRSLVITTDVADLRTLAEQVPGAFDVVLACDNSLPHLPSNDDLLHAVAQMAAKLVSGGLFLISVRDYDQLRLELPRTEGPRVIDGSDGRRIVFQVWDWSEDRRSYHLQQFIVRRSDEEWRTTCFEVEYQAFGRQDFEVAAREAGLTEIRWHEPDESGFYQPMLTARKA